MGIKRMGKNFESLFVFEFLKWQLALHCHFALVDCVRGRHNPDKHRHSVVLSMSMLKDNDVSSTSEVISSEVIFVI